MNIKDLKENTVVDEIILTITEKVEERTLRDKLRVCNFSGKDSNNENITVVLWNDDIDKVTENSKIKITEGWVRSFNNVLQISTGKNGKLEILE